MCVEWMEKLAPVEYTVNTPAVVPRTLRPVMKALGFIQDSGVSSLKCEIITLRSVKFS